MANHNWYIGQDIVCIKTFKNILKEGDTFVIKALQSAVCKCDMVIIDIGMKTDFEQGCCSLCHTMNIELHGIHWMHEKYFAPLDTLTDISEIQEILNQPIEQLFKI